MSIRSLALLLGVLFIVLSEPANAAPACWFGTVPCFLACGNPPPLADADRAALWLRGVQYRRIDWLDRSSAAITTQFFKCFGINGWRRYGIHVYAVGIVKQAATSWDGLRTVDIALADFNGSLVYQSLVGTHFVRAEVIRHVWKQLNSPLCAGDQIRVAGELHWDGHGFLEIHPSKNSEVQFLSGPIYLKKCPASK